MKESHYIAYDHWLKSHLQGTLWQSLERKKYLEACGQDVAIELVQSESGEILASALIAKDRGAAGSVWEVPRGPLWSNDEACKKLLTKIIDDAKKQGAIALYVSPHISLPSPNPSPETGEGRRGGSNVKAQSGWKESDRKIHATATRIIDLTQSAEEIRMQMHQKGRYNIGVAEKAGVIVRKGSEADIDMFYALLTNTGQRDQFTIAKKAHYSRFLSALDQSFILMAEHEGRPISGLIGVIWPASHIIGEDVGLAGPTSEATPLREGGSVGGNRRFPHATGFYYYGASSYEHRALMAPYLLQWEAMKLCRAAGCTHYDLLGIEAPETTNKPRRSRTTWQGISDFKRKFGGTVITYPPEQMIVLRPLRKMMIDLKRRILG